MTIDNHIGICLCHNFPSVHQKKYYKKIKNITENIIRAMGFKNGPVYFQYFIGEDGIMINEIAMRIGGAYEDITIPLITGIDILGLMLDYIKGEPVDETSLFKYSLIDNENYISTQLFFCKKGKVKSITPKNTVKKLKGVKEVYYDIKQGDTIESIKNATARAGYIIISGDSFDDMIENINNVFGTIKICDEEGNNLIIKYDDYENKYKFIE